ncbi:MAG TPA: lyase family protein, partial [Pseudonocardiaceae bacterium]|nr:lyase family protein [Pseudonocardiaceae bacterium]
GVALAVQREIAALDSASQGLDTCPLGAGAVAGTDLPIDTRRTAALLGFAAPTTHALDAVASRDVALRLLATATGLAVTLSRLAADLQLWSTVEFGFVGFPDRLVGGSSAMPQKRNAFLLEHVRAKPGQALGALAAAASTMATTSFTNSIEVGTEAVASVWHGLAAVTDAVLLSQVLISGARPEPVRMLTRATDGFTTATFLANRLMRDGMPFRTAHRVVGTAVRAAVDAGTTRLDGVGETPDIPTVVRAQAYGGGPGAFDEPFTVAAARWLEHAGRLRDRRRALADADVALADAVRRHCGVGG